MQEWNRQETATESESYHYCKEVVVFNLLQKRHRHLVKEPSIVIINIMQCIERRFITL